MPSPTATPSSFSSSSSSSSSSSPPAPATPPAAAAAGDRPRGDAEEDAEAQPAVRGAASAASSRFSVLLDGGQGWIQVVVYREPCDGLSQRGQPCDAHPLGSPHAGGGGGGGGSGGGGGGRAQHRSGRSSPGGSGGGGGSGGAPRGARRALTPTFERSAPIAEADEGAAGWGAADEAGAAAGGPSGEEPSTAAERAGAAPSSHAPLRRRSVLALDSYLRSVAQSVAQPPHAAPHTMYMHMHPAHTYMPTATLSAAPYSPCARSPLADGTSAACYASASSPSTSGAYACGGGGGMASSPSVCSLASDATPPATPPPHMHMYGRASGRDDASTPSPTQCVTTPSSVSARSAEAKFVRAAHALCNDGWAALLGAATGPCSHRRACEVLDKVGAMVAALGEAADEQAAVSAAREEASEAALSLLGRLPPKLHQSIAESTSAGRHGGGGGDGTKAGAVIAQMAHAPPGGVAAASLESYAHVLLHEAACSVAHAPVGQRPRELRRLQSPRLTAVLSLLRAASAASRVRRAALEAAVRRIERAVDAVRALGKMPPPSPGSSRPGSALGIGTSSPGSSRPSSALALAYMSSSSAMGSPTSSPVPPRRVCAGTASPLCAGTTATAAVAATSTAAAATSAPSAGDSGDSSPLQDSASNASTMLASTTTADADTDATTAIDDADADAGATTAQLSELQLRIEAQQQQLEGERERLRARRRSRHGNALAGGGGGGGGASPSPPPLTSSPPRPARRAVASGSSSAADVVPVTRPPAQQPPTTAVGKTLDTLQASRLLDNVQMQAPDDMLARAELELD